MNTANQIVDMRESKGAKLFTDGNVCVGENSFFVQSETNQDIVYECKITDENVLTFKKEN